MGFISQAKTKAKGETEASQRMIRTLTLNQVLDNWRMQYGDKTLGSMMSRPENRHYFFYTIKEEDITMCNIYEIDREDADNMLASKLTDDLLHPI